MKSKSDWNAEDFAFYGDIPDRFLESLRAYVETGRPTGHFLAAVLSNDLVEAVGRGDSDALICLSGLVRWLYNEAPSSCWGSPEKVRDWIADKRGLLAVQDPKLLASPGLGKAQEAP